MPSISRSLAELAGRDLRPPESQGRHGQPFQSIVYARGSLEFLIVMMTRRPGMRWIVRGGAAPHCVTSSMVSGAPTSGSTRHRWMGRVGGASLPASRRKGFASRRPAGVTATSAPARGRGALVERAARELAASTLSSRRQPTASEPRPVDEAMSTGRRRRHREGQFFVAQAAAPHLRASGLGRLEADEDVAAISPGRPRAPLRRQARRSGDAHPRPRPRARAGRACGVAPGPSRSSRVRRSGAQRRRWSAGSAP